MYRNRIVSLKVQVLRSLQVFLDLPRRRKGQHASNLEIISLLIRNNTGRSRLYIAITCIDPNTPFLIIATDSQLAIHLISTMLYSPNKLQFHKHKHTLKASINEIFIRPTRILFTKVKAHAGIHGNEKADKAAKNKDPNARIYQPLTAIPTNDTCHKPNWIKIPQYNTNEVTWRAASNLKAEIKTAVSITAKTFQQAPTNITSIKIQRILNDNSQLKETHHTEMESSLLQNTSIAQPLKSIALKLRIRNLFTKTVAHRINPTSTDEFCPLCRIPTRETQGHVLGGCTTTIMAGLKCARHGRATGLILSALRDGTQGNSAMFAHAETVELSLNRLPSWFPRHPEATDYLYRLLSKPDIILLPKITNQALHPPQLPTSHQKEAIFFEISYTTDGGVTSASQTNLHSMQNMQPTYAPKDGRSQPFQPSSPTQHASPQRTAENSSNKSWREPKSTQKINSKTRAAHMHVQPEMHHCI